MRPVGLVSLGAGFGMVAAMTWTARRSNKPAETLKKEVIEAGKGLAAGTDLKA